MKNHYYSTKFMKLALLAVILFVSAVTASNAQVWTKIDGTGFYLNDIYLPADNPAQLILSTTAYPIDMVSQPVGLFDFGTDHDGFIVSNDSGKTFTPHKITYKIDTTVITCLVFKILKFPGNPNMWLASVRSLGQGGIVISTDNGATWSADNPRCLGGEQVVDMTAKPGSPATVFAGAINTGRGIKVSTDTFSTCQANAGIDVSTRCIKISPLDPNLVFVAGDGQYFSGVLRSYDNGASWLRDSSGLNGFRILCVMPSGADKAIVYCGADSLDNQQVSHGKGIYQSLDTGKTWHLVGASGARVIDLAHHPLNPRYYAAACDSMGVYFSGSFGYSWEEFNSGLPDSFSVRKVAIPAWASDTGAYAYAYVYGKGLYKSSKVVTGVEDYNYTDENNIRITSVYPQPFSSRINVAWSNPASQTAEFSVRDILGREVYAKAGENYPQGENIFSWTPDPGIMPGMYYLVIKAGNSTATEKMMFNK